MIALTGDDEVDGVAGLHLDITAIQIAATATHVRTGYFLAESLAISVAGAAMNDNAGNAVPCVLIIPFAEIIREFVVESSLGVVIQTMLQPARDIHGGVHGGDPAAHHSDVGLRARMPTLRS